MAGAGAAGVEATAVDAEATVAVVADAEVTVAVVVAGAAAIVVEIAATVATAGKLSLTRQARLLETRWLRWFSLLPGRRPLIRMRLNSPKGRLAPSSDVLRGGCASRSALFLAG